MALKARIKTIILDQCGGSNAEFARRLNINVNTIQKWDDEHLPGGGILKRIHDEFDININWLLTGEGKRDIIKVNLHDQVGVGDSLKIEMRGPDGRIRPEDSEIIGQPDTIQMYSAAQNSSVKDDTGLWGDTHHKEVDGKDMTITVFSPEGASSGDPAADPFGQAVTGLREIFDSRDTILIPAIQANIRAFQVSARRERQITQQNEKIRKLEDECENLKARLDALEEKFKGRDLSPEELKKSSVK